MPPHDGIDLSTEYMGLRLRHPYVAGASPLSAHLDTVRRLEDGGASAIVLHSLFEEQITEAASGRIRGMDPLDNPAFAERLAPYPGAHSYPLSPDAYLEYLHKVKGATSVPIFASLNGVASGVWLKHAKLMQEAGADGLEVNFYSVVSDLSAPAEAIEGGIVRAVRDLKSTLRIPVAVKLAPFFSAFANMANRLSHATADALVIFNRFYQPDIDLATITAVPRLELSTSSELRLRLRWLALLHGRIAPSLAVTGGVATPDDGIKAILAGAHAVQLASALLRHGPGYFNDMLAGLAEWMGAHDFTSVAAIRGRASLKEGADPTAFERANYIRTLHEWKQ
ncbi:MAG: dihydroorotate dehydrogenase-like protein [Vicinamibacterales bacterium]